MIHCYNSNPTTVVIDMNDGVAAAVMVEETPVQHEPGVEKAAPTPTPTEEIKEEEKVEPLVTEPVPAPVKLSTATARAARSTVGARAPRKSVKTAKLGIKKAPVNFNFEAAEAQAKQDLERNAKYGEEEEEEVNKGDTKDSEENSSSSIKPFSSRLAYQDNSANDAKDKEDEYEKLGFGMSRMNMNDNKSSGISMPSQKSYQNQQDESRSARDKFGSARAISSDQYFGRNDYDPAVAAAESARLSQFSSAKAISSDQYFGRESDREDQNGSSYGNRSYNNNVDVSMGDWDNVQDQAVAMARKFVDQAALDLDAVKDLAENATSRVKSYFNSSQF